jgi:hypothetical protein
MMNAVYSVVLVALMPCTGARALVMKVGLLLLLALAAVAEPSAVVVVLVGLVVCSLASNCF